MPTPRPRRLAQLGLSTGAAIGVGSRSKFIPDERGSGR
jgi:hypothetical protein